MRCAGMVALVTGGQQGIGRAFALALASEGADIVLNYLDDPDVAAGIAREIRAKGRRCLPVPGDVSRAAEVATLVDRAEREMGPVDTLINNAGTFPRAAFLDLTEALWDRVHGVNLKGSFLVAQAVARRLVTRGAPGAIVNLASSAAYRSSPRGVHYVASKAGVVGQNQDEKGYTLMKQSFTIGGTPAKPDSSQLWKVLGAAAVQAAAGAFLK